MRNALRLIRAEETRPASLMQAFFIAASACVAQTGGNAVDRDVNSVLQTLIRLPRAPAAYQLHLQMMQRVDAFKVRLGVKNPAGRLGYMTINEYITAMETIRAACATPIVEDTCSKTYLNVVSMDIGILSRSTGTIGADANLNTQTSFNVAGTPVTLSGDVVVNKRYLRQAVNQVVAIRNTLGASS